MDVELPANVVAAFGMTYEAFECACLLVSMEDEIIARFRCHPVDLTVVQLREVFGVVVH